MGDAVAHVISPVLGTLDGVVASLDGLDHALAPTVGAAGQILQPLQAMGISVGLDASPTSVVAAGLLAVGDSVEDALDHGISPVLGTADGVLGSPAASLDQGLAPMVGVADHVLPPLDGMVAEADAPVTSGIAPLLAPVDQAADAILQPVASVVEDEIAPLSDVLGHQGVVASSGNILVSDLGGRPSLDDLFSKGTYTPYNLGLSAELSPASAPLPNGSSLVSMIDTIIGDQHGANPAHDGQDSANLPHGVETRVVDDLHLRGEGHGLL
jgi:hypothetical protein